MDYSEQLWTKEKLTEEQNALVRKIVNQARRTRDLVASLLSFARQAPGEKTPIDLGVLLARATQMLEARRPAGKIQVKLALDRKFAPSSRQRQPVVPGLRRNHRERHGRAGGS